MGASQTKKEVMLVLPTTYFGPVSWYAQLVRTGETVYIDGTENFVKQTERSRCRIATANGVQMLSVPVNTDNRPLTADGVPMAKCPIGNVIITDHANWRKVQWNALCSAYGESPFFEYYADDIRPFFEKQSDDCPTLFEHNLLIIRKMCELIGIEADVRVLQSRDEIHQTTIPTAVSLKPYYQVFRSRHGFVPDLSILDLLFNMGNEAVITLNC